MATSMFRRLSLGILSFSTRMLPRHTNRKWENLYTVFRRAHRHFQPRTLTAVGSTFGISYALFGFSFGKKEEDTDPLTETYRGARLAHSRRDLQKADDLYHEALKIADELVKTKQITQDKFITARTLMYDGLADIALQTGQIETAETLYKETMKGCLMQGMDQTHNVLVEIALKLASIYAMQGRKEEAEEGYKFCMNAQLPKMEATEKLWKAKEVKKGKNSPDILSKDEMEQTEQDTAALLGLTLGSYGRFLLYERRYTEALPLFEKARLYAEHTLGTDSDQYIIILNDIATLYIVTKNFDQAEALLKDGIKLSEKAKLREVAMLHCNLGAVYLRRGETPQAIRQCQLGLETAKTFDHKMAFKMAEACLDKSARVTKAEAKK